jgi:hypothetical protein
MLILKIDPVAGNMVRLGEALPSHAQIARVGPSKLAVISGGDLGVIDLDTRRGAWLTLPATANRDWPQLVGGGVGTFVRSGRGKDATLTVYALP